MEAFSDITRNGVSAFVHTISDVTGLQVALDGKQPSDATLAALAGLTAAVGLIEQTGADAFTKRLLGVTNASDVPTRADADARYAIILHVHVIEDITGLQAALDDKVSLTLADQLIAGGGRITPLPLTAPTAGATLTIDPGDRALQYYTNNAAHTLAPGSNYGSYIVDITNGATPGVITTTGWSIVGGDAFTLTNGHRFRCYCVVSLTGSSMEVRAFQ